MNISKHAIQRYAERVQEKDGLEINQFATLREDSIRKWIKKLYDSCEKIYEGKFGNETNPVKVYCNKDGWILLQDTKNNTIITLYKVDLGIDNPELDKAFVNKSLEKIKECDREINTFLTTIQTELDEINEKINSNKNKISEYQKIINNLNAENNALESLKQIRLKQRSEKELLKKEYVENLCKKDRLKI